MIASILFFSVVLTSFPLDSRALISSASMFWMPYLYKYELIVCKFDNSLQVEMEEVFDP